MTSYLKGYIVYQELMHWKIGHHRALACDRQGNMAASSMQRPWDAIAWWELRRIPYNMLMLGAGVLSLASILFIGSYFIRPGEDVIEPFAVIAGVVVYGVLANLAYTLGWITELLWSWGNTERTEPMRARIFWMGVAFSVALTLLPALLIPLIWIVFGFQHS